MTQQIETHVVKPETYFTLGGENHVIIPNTSENKMDTLIEDFHSYIKSNVGTDLSEEDKDQLYGNAQNFIKDLKRELRDAKFNFFLNRRQYSFLTTLVLQKMEYDVNTVFIAIEIRDLMVTLKDMEFKNDDEIKSCQMTPTEVTYLYHIISTHKVRGLTSDAFNFANILRRIGEISKIINYYDNSSKSLTEDLSTWAYNMGSVPVSDETTQSQEVNEELYSEESDQ